MQSGPELLVFMSYNVTNDVKSSFNLNRLRHHLPKPIYRSIDHIFLQCMAHLLMFKKYIYYMFIKRQKVCNKYKTSHTLFFIPIYCTRLFCARKYIPLDLQSHGICILAQNKCAINRNTK